MAAFSSDGREDVRYVRSKGLLPPIRSRMPRPTSPDFERALDAARRAAIRHAGVDLARQRTYRRLLLVVTDGEPSDASTMSMTTLFSSRMHARVVLWLEQNGNRHLFASASIPTRPHISIVFLWPPKCRENRRRRPAHGSAAETVPDADTVTRSPLLRRTYGRARGFRHQQLTYPAYGAVNVARAGAVLQALVLSAVGWAFAPATLAEERSGGAVRSCTCHRHRCVGDRYQRPRDM